MMLLGWSYKKFLKDKQTLHKPLKQNGHLPTTGHFFIRTITFSISLQQPLNTWFVQKKKGKGAYEQKVQMDGAYSSFLSMKHA